MKLIPYLNRPEYIFRPIQIYRRFLHSPNKHLNKFENVLLPWGVKIRIRPDPSEGVGRSIWAKGVYDLSVTEVLWRLIDSGEIAIDVGANIGYMTSIMTKRVGATGKVWCFEPNPEVYEELCENVTNWQQTQSCNQIYPQKLALSNQAGVGLLSLPTKNRGEASLVSPKDIMEKQVNENIPTYTVPLKKLDEFFIKNEQIGVIKIDVEGHELEVLRGANGLVTKQHIRDIIFEDHSGYPSPVTQFLEECGYTVFRIWKGFWRPLLEPPTKKLVHPWEPPNYLATQAPLRAVERLKKRGWDSLYGGRYS